MKNLKHWYVMTRSRLQRRLLAWFFRHYPVQVVARFAYYDGDQQEHYPSYLILESTHPLLPFHGNVSDLTLNDFGVPLPMTPTYQTWVNMGRPIYRGPGRAKEFGVGSRYTNLASS